jgi:hypothetical protein
MRTHRTVLAATAVAGSLLMVTPPAGASSSLTTLRLVQPQADNVSTFVDNAPKGKEGPGDVFTVGGTVRTTDQQKAGEVSAVFVQTSDRLAHGSVTFVLTKGTLIVEGAIDHGSDNTLSIVGGTGAYTGARGTARIQSSDAKTSFTLNFRI